MCHLSLLGMSCANETLMGQLENLKAVIKGRPVAILLPGPSIQQLEDRIEEIKTLDLCYASVNDFGVMESQILGKIGKRCELVLCAAKECGVPNLKHQDYLQRPELNIFFTEEKSFHAELKRYKRNFGNRLFFFTTDVLYASLLCPSTEQPFHFFAQASFVALTCLALAGGADTIIYFGADGGSRELVNKGNQDAPLYYKGWKSDSAFRLGYDTGVVNMTAGRIVYQAANTYQREKYRIINCSRETFYAPFPIANYDKCFELLKQDYGKVS